MTDTVKHPNIHVALAAAQAHMATVKKGSDNPHFKSKYADLADVVEAVRPALTKEGIAYYHHTVPSEMGHGSMRTVLCHGASNTSIYCDVPLIAAQNNMQAFKAACTYAKRIGLESASGVAPEDDDDAEEVVKRERQRPIPTGIGDAWRDSVLDSLPEDASPRDKAEAFAEAICNDFAGKGSKALGNAWDRHGKMIREFKSRFPDLHAKIVDAYEVRSNELADRQAPKQADPVADDSASFERVEPA